MTNPFSGYVPAAQAYWSGAKSEVSDAWNQLFGTPAADPKPKAVQGYEPPGFPFVFSSTLRDEQGGILEGPIVRGGEYSRGDLLLTSLKLVLNPKSISFKQGKRFIRHDRIEGAAFHHFTNSNFENNDLMEMDFQGNTGLVVPLPNKSLPPLDPKGEGVDGPDPIYANHVQACRIRLATWHSLYALTREPLLIRSTDTGKMIENIISITLATPLFPTPITFKGHFKEVLKFAETADKPRSRNYSMSFTVRDIEPYNIFNHVMTGFDTFTRATP